MKIKDMECMMTATEPVGGRIVWIDVESTGIDPHAGEKLIQVAAIVTNEALDEVGDPFMTKIYYSEKDVTAMKIAAVPFVQKMHDDTGLWASLSTEGQPLAEVEEVFISYLKSLGVQEGSARLGGNSITLDRNFLSVFMPRALAHLHYRSYDMTSIAGFFELFRPEITRFQKKSTHDALADIRESLAEAQYYAAHLQRPAPRQFSGRF